MRVLHVIPGLDNSSGPTHVVVNLTENQAAQGVAVSLFYVAEEPGGPPLPTRDLVETVCFPLTCCRRWAYSRALGRALKERAREFDIVHIHSVWMYPTAAAAYTCLREDVLYIVRPLGSYEPWCLRRNPLIKRAYAAVLERRLLNRAAAIHVLTSAEATQVRNFGIIAPMVVIPNGADPNVRVGTQEVHAFRERLGLAEGQQVVLFLSRIHPKKGLLHLMDAWAGLRRDFPDWLLIVAGPDQNGHRAEVEHLARDLELHNAVLFTGPLYGDDKLAALAAADFFVLPSFSEGFSMAVLEAMACGLPVLITPGCNFPEVAERGAGVVVEPTAEATERGLRQLMALTDSERRAMGQRGRQLIEEKYTWDKVAKQMIQVYEWLLGGGAPPECMVK